jgi:FeS assembly SUF system protein
MRRNLLSIDITHLMDESLNGRDLRAWIAPPRQPRTPAVAADGSPVPGRLVEARAVDRRHCRSAQDRLRPRDPADIYELGLIYKIDMDGDRNVAIVMTLTAPGCPVAGEMPQWVENAVASVTGVGQVNVTLTFDPPWDKDRMSDEAKLALNMF